MSAIGYVYKTTNLVNNKVYIGKHKGRFDPNYFGSGKTIGDALNKYGQKNFKLEVLVTAEDEERLNELERRFIADYKELFGGNCYNITPGGDGGFGSGKDSPNFGKSLKDFHDVQHCQCACCKVLRGGSKGENNPMFGVKLIHKSECRCATCKAARGEYRGEFNPMYDHHHTQETRNKLRDRKLGKSRSRESVIKQFETRRKKREMKGVSNVA